MNKVLFSIVAVYSLSTVFTVIPAVFCAVVFDYEPSYSALKVCSYLGYLYWAIVLIQQEKHHGT